MPHALMIALIAFVLFVVAFASSAIMLNHMKHTLEGVPEAAREVRLPAAMAMQTTASGRPA